MKRWYINSCACTCNNIASYFRHNLDSEQVIAPKMFLLKVLMTGGKSLTTTC